MRSFSSAGGDSVKIIELRYEDLVSNKDLTNEVREAYGPDGLGILTVINICVV